MRIVASWFGSNGSTVYKDVAVGFFTTIVNLKRAPPRVALLSLRQVIGRRRPLVGVDRRRPITTNRQYEWHKKRKHHEIST